MKHEMLRKIPAQISPVEAGKSFLLPLYSHKKNSDRMGKHAKWSPQRHTILTTLAIFTDLGFGVATAILFFSGNHWGSAGLKALHNAGAEIAPQVITNLRKQIKSTNKLN